MSDVTLSDIKRKFLEFLTLKDAIVVDIILGAVVANQFENADPVNLYLIGPPSSAKTEILMSLQGNKRCYVLSSLTPHSFISGYKEPGKAGKSPGVPKVEYSLLLRLQSQGKNILIFKDFTTVLGLNKDNQTEIISQIREIVDGYFSKPMGNQPPIEWKGKLGFIMGVTPIIDRFHTIHSQLGERFLSYRMDIGDTADWKKQAAMAFDSCGVESIVRPGIRDMVTTFLEQHDIPDINAVEFSQEIRDRLYYLTEFVGQARTGVSRDRYGAIECLPEPERTPRLMKQFKSILVGVATVQGKTRINCGLLKIIRKIARDSIPRHRDLIIKTLWGKCYCASTSNGVGRAELSEMIELPYTSVVNYLNDLLMIGIVEKKRSPTKEEVYRLTAFFEFVVEHSEIYRDLEGEGYDD